tara:strand:- start:9 stop:2825 length:2817 start_codon:yes stop_codon:yes gene_type:complete
MAIVHLGAKRVQGTKVDRVVDSLGSSADGSNTGITLITSGQKLGTGAYSFDGSDYVSTSETGLDFQVADSFSIAFWFKSAQTSEGGFINRWNSSNVGWLILKDTGTTCSFRFSSSWSSNAFRIIATDDAFSDDEWHHLAVTYNGTGYAGLEMYLDGTLLTTTDSLTGTVGAITYTTSLEIGDKNGTSQSDKYDGEIDDIGIWKRVLTATEISDLVNNTESTPTFNPSFANNNGWTITQAGSGATLNGVNNNKFEFYMPYVNAGGTLYQNYISLGVTLATDYVIRFEVNHDNAGNTYAYFGVSDDPDANPTGGTENFQGVRYYYDGSSTKELSGLATNGNCVSSCYASTGYNATSTIAWATSTTDYIEISASGGTLSVKKYSDNTYTGTPTTVTTTITSGNQGGQTHFVIKNMAFGSGWGSGALGGYIDNLKVWNNTTITSTDEGALVSSLSNKSELKANYTMDSTSLGATASIDDDFSSDNFTPVPSSGQPSGWGVTGGAMNWTTFKGSTAQGEYIALPSTFSGNFVVRFKLTPTTVVDASSEEYLWVGLTNSTSCNSATSQNQAGFYFHNYSSSDSKYQVTYKTNGGLFSGAVATSINFSSTAYWVEIIKDGDSVKLTLYSDEYVTAVSGGTATSTDGGATDSYTHFVLTGMYHGSLTGNGSSLGTIDDLEIYKDVSSLDGCTNDFSATSALDGQTNLPVNTIFEQTDDTPTYFFKQSDNSWAWSPPASTYTPDMTSNIGWADTVSDRIDNNNTTDKIDFDVHRTDTNQALSYDLGTALSNTAWTLRYKMTVSTITDSSDPNTMYMGMRSVSASSNAGTSSDFIGWHSKVWSGGKEFHYMTTDGSTLIVEGTTLSITPTTTTYYITLSRKTATTWSIRISTSSSYTGGTFVDDISCASGTQGLQYLWIGNRGVSGGSNARFIGTIEDIQIWDGVLSH